MPKHDWFKLVCLSSNTMSSEFHVPLPCIPMRKDLPSDIDACRMQPRARLKYMRAPIRAAERQKPLLLKQSHDLWAFRVAIGSCTHIDRLVLVVTPALSEIPTPVIILLASFSLGMGSRSLTRLVHRMAAWGAIPSERMDILQILRECRESPLQDAVGKSLWR